MVGSKIRVIGEPPVLIHFKKRSLKGESNISKNKRQIKGKSNFAILLSKVKGKFQEKVIFQIRKSKRFYSQIKRKK